LRYLDSTTLVAATNHTTRGKGGSIVKYSTAGTKKPIVKQRTLKKSVMCMDVNAKVGLIAVACSDMSISILDAKRMTLLTTVNAVHGFTITKVVFNPSGRLLASTSVANTVSVMEIPEGAVFDKGKATVVIVVVSLVFVVVLAVLLQLAFQYQYRPTSIKWLQ